MGEELAYCGLVCQACPIYLATREPDEARRHKMRADIAQEIEKRYGQNCGPEDVGDCDGCRTEGGSLFCTGCHIRTCAAEKGIANCAYCADYPCEALEKLFATDAGARQRLDAIRSAL